MKGLTLLAILVAAIHAAAAHTGEQSAELEALSPRSRVYPKVNAPLLSQSLTLLMCLFVAVSGSGKSVHKQSAMLWWFRLHRWIVLEET